MVKAAKAKRAAGNALRSATRLATFLSDDPGLDFGMRVAGRAASSALNQSSKLGPRPQNRIVMLVHLGGEKQRLNFDASGASREEIEQVASAFCEQAEAFRERLGRHAVAAKTNALSPPPSPSSTPPSTPPSTSPSTSPSTEAEDLSPISNSPATPPMTKVVGCPKCNAKLRVGKPGVVGCPKCGSKIRVAENLFNPEGQ
jgi:DNA-directed RNA polymerase subunit RPC12/RpoP